MAIVDYAFYKYEYRGQVFDDELLFDKWNLRAENIVHRYTLGRNVGDSTQAKYCICEVAELEYGHRLNPRVTSASNDGYSESYQTTSYESERQEIIYDWLSETDLLFRGAPV